MRRASNLKNLCLIVPKCTINSFIAVLSVFASTKSRKSANDSIQTKVTPTSSGGSDPLDVIGALTEAERISGTSLDFAKIVSIGNQSSGKSSVIDAITGFEVSRSNYYIRLFTHISFRLHPKEKGWCPNVLFELD